MNEDVQHWRELAQRHLREEASPDEVDELSANPRMWRLGLVEIKKDLDSQFASMKATLLADLSKARSREEADALHEEHRKWRNKANHFKRLVEARLSVLRERIMDESHAASRRKPSADDRIGLWAAHIAAGLAATEFSPEEVADRAVAIADAIDALLDEGMEGEDGT